LEESEFFGSIEHHREENSIQLNASTGGKGDENTRKKTLVNRK
jgi:hypothetical protein